MSTHCAHHPPALSNCAVNAAQSVLPEAWDGIIGMWSPSVGHQGMSLFPLGAGQKAPFTALNTSDYVYDQPGLTLDHTAGAAEYADTALTMASMTQYTSLVVWRRKASSSGAYVCSSNGTASNVVQLMAAAGDGRVYFNPTIVGFGSYASNDMDWHVSIGRFDGTQATNGTRMRAWHDGVEQTLSYSGTIAASTSATPGTILIGYRASGALQSNCRFSTVIVWNRALPLDLINTLTFRHGDMLRKRSVLVGKAPTTATPWLYRSRQSQIIGGGVL